MFNNTVALTVKMPHNSLAHIAPGLTVDPEYLLWRHLVPAGVEHHRAPELLLHHTSSTDTDSLKVCTLEQFHRVRQPSITLPSIT